MPPFEWITTERSCGLCMSLGVVEGLMPAATSFCFALISLARFRMFGVNLFIWFDIASFSQSAEQYTSGGGFARESKRRPRSQIAHPHHPCCRGSTA